LSSNVEISDDMNSSPSYCCPNCNSANCLSIQRRVIDNIHSIQLWSCGSCHFSWKHIWSSYSESMWSLQQYDKSKPVDYNSDITIVTQKQRPNIHDRVKLIYVDDEYSGLTQGICGTVSGIYAAKEVCKSVNRPESITWVKWDNGIDLGLIEGIDKYEIISAARTATISNTTQTAQEVAGCYTVKLEG
jgi:hypothetical protein